MRWLLTTVVLLTAVPAYADDSEAEKLFLQMERKLNAAKTLQVRFETALSLSGTTGSIKGNAVFGTGDNLRIDTEVSFAGQNSDVVIVGNGAKLFIKDSKKPAIDSKDSPKGMGGYFRAVLPRVGFAASLNEAGKAKESPKVDDVFKVSDFKLGAKEKVGGVDTRIVEYTVLVKNMDKAAAKVWIDPKTSLPAKLELRIESMGFTLEFSETYSDFVLDGKVDAKLFVAPK